MIDRTFDPGFRIRLHQKDLNLALSGPRSLGISLPATANAQQLFCGCFANRDGKKGLSAMVTALKRAATDFGECLLTTPILALNSFSGGCS